MSFSELNKIAGAFLGALLLFLLLGFFSEKLLGTGEHHDETLAFALEIEGSEEEVAESDEADAGVDLLALAQSAVASDGVGVFRQCSGCHKIEDGKNGVGPHLWDLINRPIGGVDGYSYSGTLENMGGEWTVEALMGFLENPKSWAPGTKMGYNGLKKPEDRMNLIAYLNEEGGSNADLTAGLSGNDEASAGDAAETATDATEEAAAESAEEATTDTAEAAEEATTEEAAADTSEETTSETAATDEAATEEAATETAAADEAVTEEEATETAATEEAVTEEATTETAATEEAAATDEASTEAAASEEIVTAATDPAPEAEAAAPAGMFAGVTAEDGQKVFRACRACHVVEEGKNRVGPHLYGVVGRAVAAVDGFRYSDALAGKGGEWSVEALDGFLENPKGWAPGTKMAYPGLKKPEDRAAVIKYLNENSAAPLALE